MVSRLRVFFFGTRCGEIRSRTTDAELMRFCLRRSNSRNDPSSMRWMGKYDWEFQVGSVTEKHDTWLVQRSSAILDRIPLENAGRNSLSSFTHRDLPDASAYLLTWPKYLSALPVTSAVREISESKLQLLPLKDKIRELRLERGWRRRYEANWG